MDLANHKFAHVRVNNTVGVTKHPAVDLNLLPEAGSNETQKCREQFACRMWKLLHDGNYETTLIT